MEIQELSEEARQRFIEARKRIAKVGDYVLVTPSMSVRIGQMWRDATLADDPTGECFEQCANTIYREFVDQTF